MKAIKVTEPFYLEVVEIEKPKIEKDNDVLIRITSGGICGSDIGIYNGSNSLATYPRIIGHEFGGIVEEVGNNVTGVKSGDKVAVDPVFSCGKCYACRTGHHNVCATLEVMGVHKDGGFQEFVTVSEANVHKFHKDFDESLLGIVEPFTVGMEINNRAKVTAEDKVLIMGAGPIGLCAMQVAKSRGAMVMITDIVAERLHKAKAMGADEIVLISEEDLEERIQCFTNNEGIPVIIDTVCIPSSFEQSVKMACPAGRVVVLGLKDKASMITMADITKKELTIVGSRLNCNCFDEVIEGFENGTLHPELLKTAEFNYKDIKAAFDMIQEHPQDVLKIVVKFGDM